MNEGILTFKTLKPISLYGHSARRVFNVLCFDIIKIFKIEIVDKQSQIQTQILTGMIKSLEKNSGEYSIPFSTATILLQRKYESLDFIV